MSIVPTENVTVYMTGGPQGAQGLVGAQGNAGSAGTQGPAGAGGELALAERTSNFTTPALAASGVGSLVTGLQITVNPAPAKFLVRAHIPNAVWANGTAPQSFFCQISDGTTVLDNTAGAVIDTGLTGCAFNAEVRLPNSTFSITAGNSYTFGVYMLATQVGAGVIIGGSGNSRPRIYAITL